VTLNGTGTVTVEASQPGNVNYSAAYPLQRSFTVAPSVSGSITRKEGGDLLPEQGFIAKAMLTVFPNPVHGRATIRVQVPATSRGWAGIYDGSGKQVKSLGQRLYEKGATMIEVDVQDLRRGLYFIRLNLGNESISQPFEVM
jgi:hypothetical protein